MYLPTFLIIDLVSHIQTRLILLLITVYQLHHIICSCIYIPSGYPNSILTESLFSHSLIWCSSRWETRTHPFSIVIVCPRKPSLCTFHYTGGYKLMHHDGAPQWTLCRIHFIDICLNFMLAIGYLRQPSFTVAWDRQWKEKSLLVFSTLEQNKYNRCIRSSSHMMSCLI